MKEKDINKELKGVIIASVSFSIELEQEQEEQDIEMDQTKQKNLKEFKNNLYIVPRALFPIQLQHILTSPHCPKFAPHLARIFYCVFAPFLFQPHKKQKAWILQDSILLLHDLILNTNHDYQIKRIPVLPIKDFPLTPSHFISYVDSLYSSFLQLL
jgi:hypothetical protein